MRKRLRRRLPSPLRCTWTTLHEEREGTYVLRCILSRFTSGHIHLTSMRHPVAGPVPRRRALQPYR